MKRVAVAFILVGSVLVVGGTHSFATIEADRETTVTVAQNETNAFLGLNSTNGVTVTDTETILTVQNNAESPMSLTAITDTNTDHLDVTESKWEGGTFTVHNDTLEVTCNVTQRQEGETTVSVALDATAGNVNIQKTEGISLSYRCTPGNRGGNPGNGNG